MVFSFVVPVKPGQKYSFAAVAKVEQRSLSKHMPAKFRLKRADFKLFLSKKAHRIRGAFFTVSVVPLPPGSGTKAGCVVSKKAARHSSDRNRIKRVCREVLRSVLATVDDPVILVLNAHPSSIRATHEDISADIKALLHSAMVLK